MGVEFDAIGAGNRVTSTSSISWSHTRSAAGWNHWVFVAVAVSGSTTVAHDDASITRSATYGGVPMSYRGGVTINNDVANSGWVYFFALQNPPKGTNTVSVSITKSGFTPSQIIGNSIGYYNVNSIGPLLYIAGASFTGVTFDGTQAPTGTRQIMAVSSSLLPISFTGPTGISNLYSNGASVTGLADYLTIGDVVAPSDGYTVSGNGGNYGFIAITMYPAEPATYAKTELTTYSSAGAYTYNIPQWATHIDIVMCGGGGGGGASSATRGSGGYAGEWAAVTLERGVDIPTATTQITGTVGIGGTGGNSNGASGANGGNTTATASGWTGFTAAGGAGGPGSSTSRQQAGFDAGNYIYNSVTYIGGTGGATTGGAGQPGNPPGGGGAGGSFAIFDWRRGGDGAQGVAHFYAYNVGSDSFFVMF